jgi:uroporphyrinogen decarboxylase
VTGKERILAALRNEEPDRVPVFPLAHFCTARFSGLPIREYATDAQRMASSLLAALERFGWDGVHPGCDVTVEGEALGSQVCYSEEAPPYVIRPVLMDPEEFGRLRPPNPLRDGRMPVIVGATRICAREVAGRVFVGPWTMGPLNCASQIRGVEDLLTDTLDRPEFVNALLDFCTGLLIEFGKALIDAGADAIFLGEALCTPQMVSPRFYSEIVVPRQRRLIAALKDYGNVPVALHVCGNVKRILPSMLETGADIVDLDWKMDMGESKRRCAGRAAVRGNLDPAAALLQGTPELVYEKSIEVIRAAGEGGGLILGSGCDVPSDTPPENLEAMMAAARDMASGA